MGTERLIPTLEELLSLIVTREKSLEVLFRKEILLNSQELVIEESKKKRMGRMGRVDQPPDPTDFPLELKLLSSIRRL